MRPLLVLRVLVAGLVVGGGVLALWVLGWPPDVRLHHCTAIAVEEDARTAPPGTLQAQVSWLVEHRLAWLQQLTIWGLLALGIGLGQGIAHRTHDVWRGYRQRSWCLGQMALGLTVVLTAAALIVPWPLPVLPVAMGSALLLALAGYGLAAGFPAS